MTLLNRSVSSCSLVCALSLYLIFVVGTGFQPAHAQGLPDLDEIQKIIDEARSIVAKAKECVGIADEAERNAGSAGDEKDKAKNNGTKASMYSMTAVGKAEMVATEKMNAETAANQAEKAAKDAAAAAQAAKDAAEDAADDVVETFISEAMAETVCIQGISCKPTSGGYTTTEPRKPTDKDIEEAERALEDAKKAVLEANAAATRAEDAAGDAAAAAKAARMAAENAAIAGEAARKAVEDAADDAEDAAAAAKRAATAAREAARSAEEAAGYLDKQRYASVAGYVDAARKAADAAKGEADTAKKAAENAGKYAMDAAMAGDVAGARATDAGEAADKANERATAARTHAAAARRCAEHVSEREATLASARAASAYLSRTVVNRVQKLRPSGGSSFSRPARTSSNLTGLNAGDNMVPDYPANLAVDVGYSKSSGGEGLFETRSSYVLVMTDTLLTPQRLIGFGVGTEYTRESLLGGTQRRTRGLTATAYLAEILNKNFTLVPQAALTYLNKNKKFTPTPEDAERGIRTLFSLTMLGQKQWGKVELSGFGQLAYTHEGGGDSIYLGQAIAGGEFAFAVKTDARLFVGASMGYDLVRSESTSDRFSYDGKVGLRSPLGSRAELSLSISTSRKDEEETTSGNVFVKIFF